MTKHAHAQTNYIYACSTNKLYPFWLFDIFSGQSSSTSLKIQLTSTLLSLFLTFQAISRLQSL